MTFELLFNVFNYLTRLKHFLIEKLFFLACYRAISRSLSNSLAVQENGKKFNKLTKRQEGQTKRMKS